MAAQDVVGPAVADVYRDLQHEQMYDREQMNDFIHSFAQLPGNFEPYYAYENMYHMEDEGFLTKNLVKDISGKGALHDSHHVRQIVSKSFEQHPELLRAYLHSRV